MVFRYRMGGNSGRERCVEGGTARCSEGTYQSNEVTAVA